MRHRSFRFVAGDYVRASRMGMFSLDAAKPSHDRSPAPYDSTLLLAQEAVYIADCRKPKPLRVDGKP